MFGRAAKRLIDEGIPEVVLTVAAVGATWSYVGYPIVVQGSSMMPTFNACCDVVWVSKLRSHDPYTVGEIVVAKTHSGARVIKRILAVAGEKINANGRVQVVPPGHVWLQGDNPRSSIDSRKYGPVALEDLKGRAVFKIYAKPEFLGKEIPEALSNVRVTLD